MTPKVAWLLDDSTVPLQQGDLLLVAWAKTIVPRLEAAEAAHPIIGKRDAFSLRFWNTHNPPLLDMGGCVNYALAVVVADDCAIDKEFNILRQRYTDDGMQDDQAAARANENAEPYVAIAEVWPVDALPEHLQRDAQSGALGYVPFTLGSIVPDDPRPYVADLNRIATISWRAIDRRIAMRDERWRQRLQTQLCRFFAARTIRVNEELAEIFSQQVVQAEALTPLAGNPPRTRARFHFAGGGSVIVEANLNLEVGKEDVSGRPGLQTRQ